MIRVALAAIVCLGSAPAAAPFPAAPDAPQPRQYCVAQPGFRYEFPRDHFSHECYRTEWWYFTGNLTAGNGRRFGYQLTFFREAVDNPYPNPSRWRVDDLYLAHFAISDLSGKNFFYTQRISRAGISLAGADSGQGRIWNGPWKAEVHGQSWTLEAGSLEAGGDDHQIQLQLKSQKPPAIQGVNGVSQKADGAGNASHYYSLTRLETEGQVRANGETFNASGWSWMDHEFSTSQLEPDQVGWDWISLQMGDGTDWMFYQLRRRDGSRDPHSAGSFVDEKGRAITLAAQDFEMTPLETWTSPATGARYPIRWHIRAPRLGLDVEISTTLPQQELITKETTGIAYWEGSVSASGTRTGKKVEGRGYLEMTGYADPLPSNLYSAERGN
jgi:predicted secreted hydrolase